MQPQHGAEFRQVFTEKFHEQFHLRSLRSDGRKFSEFIDEIILKPNFAENSDGSCVVRIGNTSVCCGIKAHLSEITVNSFQPKYISVNLQLPEAVVRTNKSVQHELPSLTCQYYSHLLSEMIQSILNDGNYFKTNQLDIIPNKLIWVLYIDLTCISLDGSLIDTCILAICSALSNLTLPTVAIIDEIPELDSSVRNNFVVDTQNLPVCFTFAVIETEQYHILCDPTKEEENISKMLVFVLMDCHGKVLYYETKGTSSLPSKVLVDVLKMASEGFSQRRQKIKL